MRNLRKAQSILEYVLVITGILVALIAVVQKTTNKAVTASLNKAANTVADATEQIKLP